MHYLMWPCYIVATIDGLCRKIYEFNASMYDFWNYRKHNILNQKRPAKSDDLLACVHASGQFPCYGAVL